MSDSSADVLPSSEPNSGQYTVIARRYRPQFFGDLIGQEHITQALANAITTDRVGHAYLFTGARGVGKTSAARILAKALNCGPKGPTPEPCNSCDVCEGINSGDDIDVLEIDGASNRGIDEIRQLRQNVNVRPSRTRFKIYIIDEVHMLTREAFNALLKTLEEPPEHVKFIFCTTEPSKIPVTILSRCQRFDFAGIRWESIAECLRRIVQSEGVRAEPEAISVLARRAAGSMRDGQSLLEQLLAFAPEEITARDVHAMLGSADEERLIELVGHLVDRDPAAALSMLGRAVLDGVDVGQMLEQLFGYFRDCMVAAVGCPAELFLYASPTQSETVAATGQRIGLHTLLAAMQILDQTMSRLRYSTQGRVLAELALVRIASLEDLEELASLIAGLTPGGPGEGASPPAPPSRASRPSPSRGTAQPPQGGGSSRKASSGSSSEGVCNKSQEGSIVTSGVNTATDSKEGAAGVDVPHTPDGAYRTDLPGDVGGLGDIDKERGGHEASAGCRANLTLSEENAGQVWEKALSGLSGMGARHAKDWCGVAIPAPNRLVVRFKSAYTLAKAFCEQPDQVAKFEKALADVTGQAVRVQFELDKEESSPEPNKAPVPEPSIVSSQRRLFEVSKHAMIQKASKLFGATPTRVEGRSPR